MLNRTVYYSTPSVGESSSSVALSHISQACGPFYGKNLLVKVLSQSNEDFTFRIFRPNNFTFRKSGTAYIKLYSVCGNILGQADYLSGQQFVDIDVTIPSFQQGCLHLYPTIKEEDIRYYAEPILIYTLPFHSTNYGHGHILGTVNGVSVFGNNGSSNQGAGYYQCTEFCNRYYAEVYGKNIIDSGSQGGNATDWFRKARDKGLDAFQNGGDVPPRPGDIICFSAGAANLGHVAIVMEVNSLYVKIAHQNSGISWSPIGAKLPRSGNTVSMANSNSLYSIKGWLRLPYRWCHTIPRDCGWYGY